MITYLPHTSLSKRGFTLIELMVSIALFSVVITIVSSAYLNLLSLDKQAHATDDISTNLNFVMDTMDRSLRTGNKYYCKPDGGSPNQTNCSGYQAISFTDDQNQFDTFIYDATNHAIGECVALATANTPCLTTSGTYEQMTNPNITVNSLSFYVQGVDNSNNSDGVEPQVTFVIKGQINVDSNHPPIQFDIESGATDRVIDI
jgi:prepilin-type N-terminal cleavage/methylation domain-containing protein